MKKSFTGVRWILVIIVAFLCGFQFPHQAQAAANPLLTCKLANTQLHEGGTTTLTIEVQNIADFYAYQLELRFPADRVTLLDADAQATGTNFKLGTFLSPDYVVLNEVDPAKGVASLALTQMNPTPARSGSGWLAQIEVKAVKAGSVPFTFNNVILADTAASVIAHDLQGCALEILPAGQPTKAVTATPQPTYAGPTALPTATINPTSMATRTPAATVTPLPTATLAEPVGQVTQISQPTNTPAAAAEVESEPTSEMRPVVGLPVVAQSEAPGFGSMLLVGLGVAGLIVVFVLGFFWLRSKR